MSEELSDFFALPPFKADEALVKLRRDLSELKLAEKVSGTVIRFEWKSLPVIELSLTQTDAGKAAVQAQAVKRPSQRPDWSRTSLTSSAEVRKWLDNIKLSLKRWDDED